MTANQSDELSECKLSCHADRITWQTNDEMRRVQVRSALEIPSFDYEIVTKLSLQSLFEYLHHMI